MSRMIRRWAALMSTPTHCDRPMTWEVIRASWVCGRCGAAQ